MSFAPRTLVTWIAAVILAATLDAQEADRLLFQKISRSSGSDSISYAISLPESYADGSESYPVIYFLHGMFEQYGDWKGQWMATFFHEQAADHRVKEVIVVFPDGEDGFWGNHFDGDPILETDVVENLIPHMDMTFRTQKSQRLIMGWSAGGPGATYFGLKYPDLFSGVISLDGAIITWDEIQSFQPDKANQMTGSDSVYYYEHFSPHTWAVRNKKKLIRKKETSIFLAASFFADYHARFLSLLEDQGIPVNYMALNCDHDFQCVMSEVTDELLLFLAQILKH